MRVCASIKEQALGDGLLLYDEPRDRVLMLNRTAAAIYRHLKAGKDAEDAAGELRRSFRIHADDDLAGDVRDTINHMAREGILTNGPSRG